MSWAVSIGSSPLAARCALSAARTLIAEGFLMEALETLPTEALRAHARTNLGLGV